MRTGAIISGIGHLCLILWILFGGFLTSRRDAPPIQTSDVSLISSAELNKLTASASAPPSMPQTTVKTPPAAAPEMSPAPVPKPEAAPKPVKAPTPRDQAKPDPKPVAPKEPTPPKVQVPPQPALPKAPPLAQDLAPDVHAAPLAKASQRVAPTPSPAPQPDAKVAPLPQQEVTQTKSPTPVKPQKPKEAAAPKEASTQIVPEAPKNATADTAPSSAPKVSLRPMTRPPEPAAQTASAAQPAKPTSAAAKAEAAALAAAMGDGATTGPTGSTAQKTSGPPLTSGEKNGLRLAVQQCWVVDPGSLSANVTVTVAVRLNQDGTVIADSLKEVTASGGDAAAERAAFDAARRAILRCGRDGYKLPPEKYDQWRDIEMIFDPNGMRMK